MRNYENAVLLLMSIAMGFCALDRLAINFLSPFIVAEMHLGNAELGLLSSAFSTSAAIAGVVFSSLADRSGNRKKLFLAAFTCFALLSASTALAPTFAMLILARIATGVAAGPLTPTAQSIIYLESSEQRRGFNMGFLQNFGVYLIAMVAGPIICTQLGADLGWRRVFFLSVVPATGVALLLQLFLRNPQAASIPGAGGAFLAQVREALASRNLRLCLAISSMCGSWLVVQFTFMPRYLIEVSHMRAADAGLLMSLIGISGALGGVLVSALSDRYGRKPTLVAAAFGGVIGPLILLTQEQGALMALGMFIGWLAGSSGPLYLAIVPTESVSPRLAGTAVALALGLGEVIGGIIAPAVAGFAADLYGLRVPFILAVGFATIAGVFALFLEETAPAGRRYPCRVL